MVINFPLRNAFLCPIGSDRWHFCFHLLPGMLWFPLLFLLWPTDCWAMCYSASNCLHIFCCFLLLLSTSFIALWSNRMRESFLFSCICWIFLHALRYDLYWRKFHGLLSECICAVVG
jgi:hypothetical protein